MSMATSAPQAVAPLQIRISIVIRLIVRRISVSGVLVRWIIVRWRIRVLIVRDVVVLLCMGVRVLVILVVIPVCALTSCIQCSSREVMIRYAGNVIWLLKLRYKLFALVVCRGVRSGSVEAYFSMLWNLLAWLIRKTARSAQVILEAFLARREIDRPHTRS